MLVIGLIAFCLIAAGAWFLFARYRPRSSHWPVANSAEQLGRYCEQYLKRHGWQTERRSRVADVVIARKAGCQVRVCCYSTFQTLTPRAIRDIRDFKSRFPAQGSGVVLTQTPASTAARHESQLSGVPILGPDALLPYMEALVEESVRSRGKASKAKSNSAARSA
jgi:hypothetical protein